ncbi:MAG TPA: hypothetical protein VFL42_08295, partial [Terriglobales bacterium]|nr:hypothetical protein [Terriglobales bacterium]
MLNSHDSYRRWKLAAWGVILLTFSSASAQKPDGTAGAPAEGQPTSPQSQQAQADKTEPKGPRDAQEDAVTQSVALTPTVDVPQVKELGGHGTWFSENVDWLHIGPVGIRSADAFYTYLTEKAAGSNIESKLSAATFHANVAFDKRLQHSRLIWQYNPRIVEVNGHVSQQLTNQDSTLDIVFAP